MRRTVASVIKRWLKNTFGVKFDISYTITMQWGEDVRLETSESIEGLSLYDLTLKNEDGEITIPISKDSYHKVKKHFDSSFFA